MSQGTKCQVHIDRIPLCHLTDVILIIVSRRRQIQTRNDTTEKVRVGFWGMRKLISVERTCYHITSYNSESHQVEVKEKIEPTNRTAPHLPWCRNYIDWMRSAVRWTQEDSSWPFGRWSSWPSLGKHRKRSCGWQLLHRNRRRRHSLLDRPSPTHGGRHNFINPPIHHRPTNRLRRRHWSIRRTPKRKKNFWLGVKNCVVNGTFRLLKLKTPAIWRQSGGSRSNQTGFYEWDELAMRPTPISICYSKHGIYKRWSIYEVRRNWKMICHWCAHKSLGTLPISSGKNERVWPPNVIAYASYRLASVRSNIKMKRRSHHRPSFGSELVLAKMMVTIQRHWPPQQQQRRYRIMVICSLRPMTISMRMIMSYYQKP